MPTKKDIIEYLNGIEGTPEELSYAYEQILYTCWFQKHKITNPPDITEIKLNIVNDLTNIENKDILIP
jgi:hypothetical protein